MFWHRVGEAFGEVAKEMMDTVMGKPKEKPAAVILSLHGTLASCAWRAPIATNGEWHRYYESAGLDPIVDDVAQALAAIDDDIELLVIANCPEKYEDVVRTWLTTHNIQFKKLYCWYNSSAYKTLDELNKSTYTTRIKAHYAVQAVVESVPNCYEMWRAEGLRVQLVNDPALPAAEPPKLDTMPASQLTDVCGQRIGLSQGLCNDKPNHGGTCSWSSAREDELKKLRTEKNRTTQPQLPAPEKPATLPAIGENTNVCGKKNDAGDICVKDPHHKDDCHFTKVVKTPASLEDDEIEWYGQGVISGMHGYL